VLKQFLPAVPTEQIKPRGGFAEENLLLRKNKLREKDF
jgi:hypothetical protein